MLEVRKRDGRVVPFDRDRIKEAIGACFVNGCGWRAGWPTQETADQLARNVEGLLPGTGHLTVEAIQDVVEGELMRRGYQDAAKAYILYREERRKERDAHPEHPDADTIQGDLDRRFPTPLQAYQFMSKYARWDEAKGRRETWEETVDRVLDFMEEEAGREKLHFYEWQGLRDAMLKLEVLPSMRLVQMAGPAAKRCHVSIYNCSYLPILDLRCFAEALYILMQGTGVGFSVERQYVDQLPVVAPQHGYPAREMTIADSTEGWCDAFLAGLIYWFHGWQIIFDYSQIRPAGAILKTKGGRASGPEPLRRLLEFTKAKILSRQGQKLRPIDVHDILCQVGEIVQVGGVRRAAEISLFDVDDEGMRHAKAGEFWNTAPQRVQANNSQVWNGKPTQAEFLEKLWLPLMQGGTGEPGILNREGLKEQKPERRAVAEFGTNPCGEIALRPFQFCNLSIVVARADDTLGTLQTKVLLAALWGTLQSTLTRFNYLRDDWQRNCDEERLLGVDITGWADCPLLNQDAQSTRGPLLQRLRHQALATNAYYADILGVGRSAAVTCVKPSGNSSTLVGCSPGIHPREAPYYIRRVRASAMDPVTKLLQEAGVPWFPENGQTIDNCVTVVFEFPVKSPDGADCYDEMPAQMQLSTWLSAKANWTEHNPSCTIRVRDDEWLYLGERIYWHWDMVGGLSFLPMSDQKYSLMPYEAITKEEYEVRVAAFPAIPWKDLARFETSDQTTGRSEFACTSGACEI